MSHNFSRAIYLLLSLCFLWMLTVFFPGAYSFDTWVYFNQAMSGVYGDWHSPAVAYSWELLYSITEKYYSFYIVLMCMYWYFFYLLLRLVENKLTLLIGLFFFLLFVFIPQYVIKDSMMALAWGIGSALLIPVNGRQNKGSASIALLLLVYGLFIRPHLVITIIPLLYIFVETFMVRKSVLRISVAVLIILGLSMYGFYTFTYKFIKAERNYLPYNTKLHDVIGISKKTGKDYMPSCFATRKDYNRDSVMFHYHEATSDHIFWPPSGAAFLPPPERYLDSCLTISWRKAITEHPLVYLENRYKGFLYYLRIKKRFASTEYWNVALYYVHTPNPVNVVLDNNAIVKRFNNTFTDLGNTAFFDPWLWLLLNFVFFFVFWYKYYKTKEYHYKVLAFIQLSGILFTLTIFPVFPHDRDFRYNYWNVFVFIIGFLYLFRHQYIRRLLKRS